MTTGAATPKDDANTSDDREEGLAGKYMSFKLDEEEYGLEILRVREIIGLMDITRVPRTQEFIRGVINLRGKVIPVIDLRLRFALEKNNYTERTCIIVVEIEGPICKVMIGLVVDSVSEVLNIKGEDIEDTPAFGAKMNTDFILGMAKMEGGVKILLDINRVLNTAEVGQLEKAA